MRVMIKIGLIIIDSFHGYIDSGILHVCILYESYGRF
jgi:hypothetical protein